MEMIFDIVTGEDSEVEILYDFLSRRKHKISHDQMPTYDQHRAFVRNHPYLSWYLIKVNSNYIGDFYVTDKNTIGINILDNFLSEKLPLLIDRIKSEFVPLPAIKSIRGKFFSINVAPSNCKLIEGLERNG